MDDDRHIDDRLVSLHLVTLMTRIYELLPADWEFYGPIMRTEGWSVGVRTRKRIPVGYPNELEATNRDLVEAFRERAEGIKQLELPPTEDGLVRQKQRPRPAKPGSTERPA